MKQRKILITSALNYANGALHLGHMVECIQTDIWARFQRLRGHACYYICGSDAHGTPIMLAAEKAGLTPEALVEANHRQHVADLGGFHIDLANYYTTHSPENQQLANAMFEKLQARGDIESRTIQQAYDKEKQLFLPDRYVKGQCPRCHADDQYGDNCEACGATYAPVELIKPVSVLSGTTPIEKTSEHLFFRLDHYQDLLQDWLNQGHLQTEIVNKLTEWFNTGLQAWDISRDAPYFGFEIPGHPDKYFYVWLDAPIGYMASWQHYCEQHPELSFDEFWQADSSQNTELYHVVGKDIVYFHALFWPAMLAGSEHRLPTNVFAHGFLTVNGEKMSKSRGTFIEAKRYLQHLDADYLRYYYAAKLGSSVQDIDLNFDDFKQRVNSDLVGKLVNIASRSAGFIHKLCDGLLVNEISNTALFAEFIAAGDDIAEAYEKREYHKAMRLIMALADKANQYIAEKKPWELAKQDEQQAQVQAICSDALNLFRVLLCYLKPVVPSLVARGEAFLNVGALTWDNRQTALCNHRIEKFKPLMNRISDDAISALQTKA